MPDDTIEKRTDDDRRRNDARTTSMSAFEERYAEPPAHSEKPPSKSPHGQASTPNLDHLNFEPNPLEIPTPAECIAHLRLLHAFAKLRQDVGNRDDLVTTESLGGDEALAERLREKRWTVYVTKAVDRFEKWWKKTPKGAMDRINALNFDSSRAEYTPGSWNYAFPVSDFPLQGNGLEEQENFRLPPLDVLMVWHAYMLNPRVYLEDSIRFTKNMLWRTVFPWQMVFAAIDGETFEYRQNDAGAFAKDTGCSWEAFRDKDLKVVECPKCTKKNSVDWTKPPDTSDPESIGLYLTYDTGYTGKAFEHICKHCSFVITHEKLRVGRFIRDAEDLMYYQEPLRGTILRNSGVPNLSAKGKNLGSHDSFFPNRVIQKCSEFRAPALREELETLTVSGLKEKFQTLMSGTSGISLVNTEQLKPEFLAKGSKVAVRKVLSHYWDNSSVFGVDLVGAVLRQGSFVQKMRKFDWLHSPALSTTVRRLIVKYHRFVRIAGENPRNTVVPTLDIDLAWHTHQLTPRVYYRYTLAETRKFLNHDDKTPESTLHTAFQWTSRTYEKKYAQPYSECCCWYCESTREPLRSAFLSKIHLSRSTALSVPNLAEKAFSKDSDAGVHISAHSALPDDAATRRRDLDDLDLVYARVCKRYAKSRTEPPARGNEAAVYGPYGYPVVIPVEVPYEATPTAAHGGSGCGGGCAAGTCAVGTSLGSCAGGSGTPGCKASCGGSGNADGGCGTCGGGDGGGGCGGGGD